MLGRHRPGRRDVLVGTAACLIAPRLKAQGDVLVDVAARASGMEQLHALVVSQGGAEVMALAPRGPGLERTANLKSVSKTLLALMTGIAIERDFLDGVDQPVLPLLGRAPAGDALDDLTLGHLLSMRTGLERTSGAGYGAWIASDDWVDYVLTRDLVDRPGGRFLYSTGGWHVLGAVLARAAGRDLHTLARDWLGAPLGLDVPAWVRDPQGRLLGGNEMALSPRGLSRVGQMVLAGGTWQGTQVVPAAWIAASWVPRARSPFSGDAYGYGWFLTRVAGQEAAYARGYGGQMLVVIPTLDAAIAITSNPTLPARSGGYFSELRELVDAIAVAVA